MPGNASRTRLGEFAIRGRAGPIAALTIVSAAMFFADGFSPALRLLLGLCAAYAVAFVLLACLARVKGVDPPWRLIVATAGSGVVLGGFAAAAVAVAPEWGALSSWDRISTEWQIGAAFSAFFVGLSLVTSAVRQSEATEFETQRQLLEARLKMLSAQIEPHFLMNSLANLRYLIRSDPSAAYEMLEHLTDFLQAALERSRDLSSTLGEELRLIESYLRIMQIRMGEKLQFEIDVPEDLQDVQVPALLVQTLIENALIHGIEPRERQGLISIRALSDAETVTVAVVDDGVGFDPGSLKSGTGLRNVQDRLETFYGGAASYSIDSAVGRGTEVKVSVPGRKA